MQGAFARKKEEHKPAEAAHAPAVSPFDSSVHLSEKKAPAARQISQAPSASEGLMPLRESQNVEQQGRASFEKSVRAELDAMKARLALRLAAQKKEKGKKKRKRKDRKKKGNE
jgi:hypothetical protein